MSYCQVEIELYCIKYNSIKYSCVKIIVLKLTVK
jgi:hypothetical protein